MSNPGTTLTSVWIEGKKEVVSLVYTCLVDGCGVASESIGFSLSSSYRIVTLPLCLAHLLHQISNLYLPSSRSVSLITPR